MLLYSLLITALLTLLAIARQTPVAPLASVLLLLLPLELSRLLRRCGALRGRLVAEEDRRWRWQQALWWVTRPPFVLPFGVVLSLRTEEGRREVLWLWRDSMDESSWRALRRMLHGYAAR